jgi:hypothetical protein
MTVRNQILSSSGSFSINSLAVRNIPTGLQDQFGNALTPHFVELITICPFLMILQKNANGSFDIYNPTNVVVAASWKAHHLHSFEQEPVVATTLATGASAVPAPVPVCAWPVLNPLDIHAITQKYATDNGRTGIPDDAILDINYQNLDFLRDVAGDFTHNIDGSVTFNSSGYYKLNASLLFTVTAELYDEVALFVYRKLGDPAVDTLTNLYKIGSYYQAALGTLSNSLEIDGSIVVPSPLPDLEERTYFIGAQSSLDASNLGATGGDIGLPAADYCGLLNIIKIG